MQYLAPVETVNGVVVDTWFEHGIGEDDHDNAQVFLSDAQTVVWVLQCGDYVPFEIMMPRRVSLLRDAERIEAKLKSRLGAVKYEELYNRMKVMPDDELRELLEAVLDELEYQ